MEYSKKVLRHAFKAGQFAGVIDILDEKEYDHTLRVACDEFEKEYAKGYHYGYVYEDMRKVYIE